MKPHQKIGNPVRENILLQKARSLLQNLIYKKNIHHAVLGMETGDGTFRQVIALGEACPDGTPMEEDTPYLIASVTKLFIAATVFMLAEEKEIDLDIPITEYFPNGYLRGLHVLNGKEYTSRITTKHLLSHTSGLPDWLEDRPRGGKSLFEVLLEEEDRYYSFDEVLTHVRERLYPRFIPQPLEQEKVRIRYSDTNFQLLISIIEKVRHRSIPEVFGELIFRPLGLQNTFFLHHPANDKGGSVETPITANKAAILWAGGEPFLKKGVLATTRDLYSTAADQLTFLKALMNGSIFNRPETIFRMTERWNRFAFPTSLPDLRLPGYPIQYGYGIMRFQLPKFFTPFRRIPAVIGHTGSTGSWLFYCPWYDLYLSGTVDQVTAGAVPFRFVVRLLHSLR